MRFTRIVIFTALAWLALFCCVSEWMLRQKAVQDDVFHHHLAMYHALKGSTVTAIALGDSQMSQGFTGTASVPNFADAGETVPQMQVKLTSLEKRLPSLRYVILQSSPHMFADYRYDVEGQRDYEALWQDELPVTSYLLQDAYLRSRLSWYWQDYLMPAPRQWKLYPYGSILVDGHINSTLTKTDRIEIARRAREHGITGDALHSLHMQVYEAMLADLHRRDINVCMVEMPVTAYYRDAMKGNAAFPVLHTHLHALAQQYGFRYVDYWNDTTDYMLFRDGDHLNADGAGKYTASILRDCHMKPN